MWRFELSKFGPQTGEKDINKRVCMRAAYDAARKSGRSKLGSML
jgi:hypothetical protein